MYKRLFTDPLNKHQSSLADEWSRSKITKKDFYTRAQEHDSRKYKLWSQVEDTDDGEGKEASVDAPSDQHEQTRPTENATKWLPAQGGDQSSAFTKVTTDDAQSKPSDKPNVCDIREDLRLVNSVVLSRLCELRLTYVTEYVIANPRHILAE